MGKKVRSAKGVYVDFDLLKIKHQIAATPSSGEVKARQNFIEKKLRRRVRKVDAPVVGTLPIEPIPQIAIPPSLDQDAKEPEFLEVLNVPVDNTDVSDQKTNKIKQKARTK